MRMTDMFSQFAQQIIKHEHIPNLPTVDLSPSTFASALKLVFGVAGAIAVLIVTLAGFKYVVSMGNPESAARAKNAIIYALVGVLVCAVAFSVVTFVAGKL